MTRFPVLIAALFLTGASPDITGLWLTQDGAGVVSIEPCGDGTSVCGKFVGFRDQPPPKDYQGASECGLEFIHPAQLGNDGSWHGEITDPTQGSDYRADLAVMPDGTILCFFEKGQALTLARFNLEWLTDGMHSEAK